ncbi:MAG: hydroxymethylbilane synthase [Armatimonadetes bacterium]|jgi:hydroxymethylbilane synthase|nr:hydroxymethylbilane synthase [Armatimonadota bacterium]
MQVIRVGSRGSALALRQTRTITELIADLNPGIQCSIEVIRTTGDRILDTPLTAIGEKGLFVKEIEAALLTGEIDVAVHSAKDLPSEMDDRLCIAAFPQRICPADALISKKGSLKSLPANSVVGTSSLRRRAQILAVRRDIILKDLRGNIDTRLRKLDDGQYDAIILAAAGLKRLGLESRITELLDYQLCLPAVGQGALAIQCRADDPICEIMSRLDCPETRCCVTAERALLAGLGGGCQVPIAALARIVDGQLVLDGLVADLEGKAIVRKQQTGDTSQPDELGSGLGALLLDSPAGKLLEAAHNTCEPKDQGAV